MCGIKWLLFAFTTLDIKLKVNFHVYHALLWNLYMRFLKLMYCGVFKSFMRHIHIILRRGHDLLLF